MSQQARVTSVDALDAFRANLIIFVTKAREAVDSTRDRVRRTRNWLQQEQPVHWQGEIRKRQRHLDQVVQELYSARLTQMTGAIAIREAAVRKAKAAVEEAHEKLRKVKKWNQNFDATADPLVKKLDGFREYLDHEMPDAITFLYRAREILDAYAERNAPVEKPAPAAADAQASPADAPPANPGVTP
ncbi:MAG: hypothetical protein ABIP20_02635 [Chthoniobacteraceae bacterium]